MLDDSLPVATAEAVAVPLVAMPTLPQAINAAHAAVRASGRTMLLKAREAGEHLLKAKDLVQHGKFKAWIEANCECSYRTAAKYMRVAKCADLDTFDAAMGVDAFLQAHAKAAEGKTTESPQKQDVPTGGATPVAGADDADTADGSPPGESPEVVSLRQEVEKLREMVAENEAFFDEEEAKFKSQIAELQAELKASRRELADTKRRLRLAMEASPSAARAAREGEEGAHGADF